MKRLFLLFLLIGFVFVIIIPNISASDKLYDSYVFSGQSITIDNNVYMIYLNENYNSLLISTNNNFFTVGYGSCETYGNLNFCFNETKYDIDKRDYKAKVIVYRYAPTISISRTISKTKLYVGDSSEINVLIKNNGPKIASNVSYIDEMPSDIVIEECSGCDIVNNSVVWNGNLATGKDVDFSYKIKPLKKMSRYLKARLDYFDGYSMKEKYSSSLKIDVKPIIDIDYRFVDVNYTIGYGKSWKNIKSEKSSAIGEEFVLLVNLTNKNDNKEIKSNISIYVPEGIYFEGSTSIYRYVSKNDTEKIGHESVSYNNNTISFSYDSKANESKIVALKFYGKYVVSSDFVIKMSYSKGKDFYSISPLLCHFEVKNIDLKIWSSLDDKQHFDSNQEFWLRTSVQNVNDYSKLKNIRVTINTTFNISRFGIKKSYWINQINESDYVVLFNKKIVMPYVNKTTGFNFDVCADYETEFGDRFKICDKKKFYIDPIKAVVIEHSVKTSVEEGDEFDVITYVKNIRNDVINDIEVSDNPIFYETYNNIDIKKKISVDGVTSRVIDINPDDKIAVYSYEITAPDVRKEGVIKIETTAIYKEDNITYNYTKTTDVKVKPKKLNIGVSKSVDTNVFIGQIVEYKITIENKDSEAIKDIEIKPILQQDVDWMMDNSTIRIGKLDPGEKITKTLWFRPKYNGTIRLNGTIVFYSDYYGNIFNITTSSTKINVDYSYAQGPLVLATIETDKRDVNVSDVVYYSLVLRNIGEENANVTIYNGNLNKTIYLFSGETKRINYEDTASIPSITLGPFKIVYSYVGKKVYGTSNDVVITVEKPVSKEKEIIKKEEEKKVNETNVERKEGKGIFSIINEIMNAIRRMFIR